MQDKKFSKPGLPDTVVIDGVSVIICCYNSADRIVPTLQHLAAQRVPAQIPWEIVLVNNASTDDIDNIATAAWKAVGSIPGFRIVYEGAPGLANARTKGIESAKYEGIIFCDDDNWLDPNYIATAYEALANNPSFGVIGGHGEGVTDGEFPGWFHQERFSYAAGTHYDQSKDITNERSAWGAGMVSRRSLLKKVFNQNTPLLCSGRKENKLTSGDDDEICVRVILLGYHIYFHHGLRFKHYIAPWRLTKEYYQRMWDGFKEPQRTIHKYRIFSDINDLGIFKKYFLIAFNLAKLSYGKVIAKKEAVEYATMYLYYLTGYSKWADEDTKAIRNFYLMNTTGNQ